MGESVQSGGTRGSGSGGAGSVSGGGGGSAAGGAPIENVGGEASDNGYNVGLEEAAAENEDFVIIPTQVGVEPRTEKGKEVATWRPTTCTGSLLHYFNSSRNSLNTGPLDTVPVVAMPPNSQRLSQTMADLFKRRRERKPKLREVPLRIGSPRRDEGGSPTRIPRLSGHASRKGKEQMPETLKSRAKGKENVLEDLSVHVPILMDVDIAEGAQVFVNCSDEETLIVVSGDDVDELQEGEAEMTPVPNPVLRRRQYEASRRFQDTWPAKLPWAEMVVGGDGHICQVKCLICSAIQRRIKLLLPKWDTLTKHAGRRRADRDIPGVAKRGEYYYSRNCAHAKNAILYASRGPQTVAEMTWNDAGERSRKRVQFATVFHILAEGRPMVEYESLNSLFSFLQVRHLPKKHWSDNSGWAMAEVLYGLVKTKLAETLANAQFFAITCDEATSVDNQSWLSIHIYTMKDWVRQPYLLALKCCVDGGSANNMREAIVNAMRGEGALSQKDIAEKFVSFGADGVSVFQGPRTGVTRQLKENHAPWMDGNHCMSHRFQLAIATLSRMAVVSGVEDTLGSLYNYFSHSHKRHNEFVKLATMMNRSHDKILRQVKTRWISMLKPAKRVLAQYDTLLYKMHLDAPTVKTAGSNLDQLCDVETLLGLSCLLPLLETLNGIIKFSQGRNIFVCDFVGAIRACQTELFQDYCDPNLAFTSLAFSEFKALVGFTHDKLQFEVKEDLNTCVGQLVFVVGGAHILAKYRSKITGAYEFVSEAKWAEIVGEVKAACKKAAKNVSAEITSRFPAVPVMDALGMFYPQYWLQKENFEHFDQHLTVLKNHYSGQNRIIGANTSEELSVDPIISWARLNYESGMFRMTMQNNAPAAMERPLIVNPFTALWRTLSANTHLRSHIKEFMKLAEIACVQVLGSVEDERTFSNLAFIKNKLWNRLTVNLETAIGMYAQPFFSIENFPYGAAYAAWSRQSRRPSGP